MGIWSGDTVILVFALTISWFAKFGIESYFLVKKCFGKSLRNYMKVFIPELFIFAFSNCILYGMMNKIQYGLLLNIVIKTLVIMFVYYCFCIILNKYNFLKSFKKRGLDNMNKRLTYMDIFRGMGIILMIMGHVGFGKVFDHFIHAFHMPMFFFISGFFYNRNKTFGVFIKNKAKFQFC